MLKKNETQQSGLLRSKRKVDATNGKEVTELYQRESDHWLQMLGSERCQRETRV